MKRKGRIAALLVACVLAMGLIPGLALAATSGDDAQGTDLQLTTQATRDIGNCTIKFTDNQHKNPAMNNWQMYFAMGKTASVTPQFDLYYNGKKIAASSYTVSYQLTYWDDDQGKEVKQKWTKPLIPSASPEADSESMSSEYNIVVKGKGSYTGSQAIATVCVVDYYNVGRNMAKYWSKAKDSWQYSINPMNNSYFVIPQSKVKSTLNSLVVMAGCSPGEGGMNHDGTKVDSKYYTVTYYKAKKNAVRKNMSPASLAKSGSALTSMPTNPGSYVMIIKGKKPYYGKASVYFDIQGSMDDVTIGKVAAQTEDGEYIEPNLTVKYKGTVLKEDVDYVVTYENNLKAGTATATITGAQVLTNNSGYAETVNKARYFTGSKSVNFTIKKNKSTTWVDNPMTVTSPSKVKEITASAATINKNRKQVIPISEALTVKNAEGDVKYMKTSGTSLITVGQKTGVITVKAAPGGARVGTYKIKVKILASGDETYYAKAMSRTITVNVK